MKQEWVCEDCGLHGTTEYLPGDGVFAVVYAIRDHHERLASRYAPKCHFDLGKVRVRNYGEMSIYEWNKLVREIEEKQKVNR